MWLAAGADVPSGGSSAITHEPSHQSAKPVVRTFQLFKPL
jgi:hypothetical protein